jgi:ubiquinone/menaquinone biosynthesis C-methylase UbiE
LLTKFQRPSWGIVVFLLLVLASAPESATLAAQTAPAEESTHRKTSTPYKGDLSIFESSDRDKKLQVQRVMDILGIHSGSAVADIGAGSGWFTVRAAKRVGEQGTVYAVDINPEAISYINDRVNREATHNVRTVLGAPDDPKLPPNSVDSVLILKTYHEIAEPVRLLENLRRSLRSGARVGVIDRNGNGEDHGIAKDVIVQEAARAGYHLTSQYDFVKADREDYFLVFEANAQR